MCVCVCVCGLSHVQLFVTPWTIAHQAPLPLEFSRQEYWSGLPIPTPGGLSNSGIEPESPALQADPLPTEPQSYLLSYHLDYYSIFCFHSCSHVSILNQQPEKSLLNIPTDSQNT